MVQVSSPTRSLAQQAAAAKKWKIVLILVAAVIVLGWFKATLSLASTTSQQVLQVHTRTIQHIPRPKPQRLLSQWPSLKDIYNGKELIADPQFLLDFAIIGFEKSGSSTFMKWLGDHPQIQCFQEEIYDIYKHQLGVFVTRLYNQLKPGFHYKRGYKSPGDIFLAKAIQTLDDTFPKTRLILALRHPVLYYQSIYNFRIQNLAKPEDPFHTPNEGIGECQANPPGYVCTNHANYAQYVYRLGKTLSQFPTATEQLIINEKPQSAAKARVTRNLIFVVEISQLQDKDPLRKQVLRDDLRDFLGLDSDLPDPPKVVPGKKWPKEVQAIKDARKMHICEDQYLPLRAELMRVSRITATWILESFVQSDDVFTSSPEYFERAIRTWMEDPCDRKEKDLSTKWKKEIELQKNSH